MSSVPPRTATAWQVDFTGRKDGVEFDGGKATDFPFVVGGYQMLKDFETAVAGPQGRREQDLRHDLPVEYHAENLAGQTVQFEVAVKQR